MVILSSNYLELFGFGKCEENMTGLVFALHYYVYIRTILTIGS